MSIFERSVTCSFFPELYSHIDKNPGEKFEHMFLVKIASKGTSLKSEEVHSGTKVLGATTIAHLHRHNGKHCFHGNRESLNHKFI